MTTSVSHRLDTLDPREKLLAIDSIASLLRTRIKGPVLITAHLKPDGDAIGSVQAAKILIEALGHHDVIGYVPDVPDYLAFAAEGLSATLPLNYETVIAVDVAASRGERSPLTSEQMAGKLVINIDHHESNSFEADIQLVSAKSSSACELLWDIAERALYAHERDALRESGAERRLAEAVYLGLRTDTGSFAYQLTSAHTLKVAAACMEAGADTVEICNQLATRVFDDTQILGTALDRARAYVAGDDGRWIDGNHPHPDLETIIVTRLEAEDIGGWRTFNSQPPLAMLRSCEGCIAAIAFSEDGYEQDQRMYKVSLRSNGLNVAKVAQLYGGGGHAPAAGCRVREDQIDELIQAVGTAHTETSRA